METMVRELKKVMQFKETTTEGDVVLVAVESNKSVFYAVVTDISRDDSRRDEWWHVSMQVLSVPPQQVVWTLREPQFSGKETFTMAGDGRFMQAVDFSVKPKPLLTDQGGGSKKSTKPRPLLKRVK